MKSNLIFLMVLSLSVTVLFSQTNVSGNQSGTWIAADSPYLVIGQLVVPNGETLTIEAGVEVNFQGYYKFTVNGYLDANGTEADSIFFTTDNQSIGWGGIRFDDSDGVSNLSFCRIEYGKTSGDYPDIHGGAIALLGADAVFTNCVFANNDATGSDNGMGGAVYAFSPTETKFINCLFIGNHAYGEGGAIKFSADNNTEIINCSFIENNCLYGGGAISCYLNEGTIIDKSLFAGNYTMYSNGGALNTLGMGNHVNIYNSTFTDNHAVTGDGGAIDIAYGEIIFVNVIIYDNPGMYSNDLYLDMAGYADVNYSNLEMPSGATGINNINANPLFTNPTNYDFTLQENSPSIDTGTAYFEAENGDTLVYIAPEDYFGVAPDMGAFEYETVGVNDNYELPITNYELSQNYPNPFNPVTRINYELGITNYELAEIVVHNSAGQAVWTSKNLKKPVGATNFDGSKFNSGIYYYSLVVDGKRMDTKSMILIK